MSDATLNESEITFSRALNFNTVDEYKAFSETQKQMAEIIVVGGLIFKNRGRITIYDPPVDPTVDEPTTTEETNPPSVEELVKLIHQWGVDRNIIGGAQTLDQLPKLVEEFSEIIEGVTLFRGDLVIDGIGDTSVVAIMMAGIEGTYLSFSTEDLYASDPSTQSMMIILGKLSSAVAKKNIFRINTYLNAFIHQLIHFARVNSYNYRDCLQTAYNTIKDRQGILADGVFIKSDDENYAAACERVARQRAAASVA